MRWLSDLTPRSSTIWALLLVAAPAWGGEVAYVTCQNGDALSVLDLETGAERQRVPLPGKPAGVALAPDGSVYTVSPDSKTVRRLNRDGEVLAETMLDGGPIGVATDSKLVFVSDWYNARIWVLDAITLSETAVLSTGSAPAGLAIDNGYLASADRDADQVSIFDISTHAKLDQIAVGLRPFGLSFAPDGRLFVGNVGSNDVSVIDIAKGKVTATVSVGERPYGIAFAEGRAFVSNQYADTVSVIDLATLKPIKTISVGEYPEGIDSIGKTVAVANWFENTVTLIDAASLTVTTTIATADGPRAFGKFLRSEGDDS